MNLGAPRYRGAHGAAAGAGKLLRTFKAAAASPRLPTIGWGGGIKKCITALPFAQELAGLRQELRQPCKLLHKGGLFWEPPKLGADGTPMAPQAGIARQWRHCRGGRGLDKYGPYRFFTFN